MPDVIIITGSKSDLPAIEKGGGILTILEAIGVSYEVSVISAHRNAEELAEYCKKMTAEGAKVFVGVAGLAAALPGAIAGVMLHLRHRVPVIGVPLDEHGIDSVLYMPPGVPVALAGVGTTGLKNAALLAAQIVAGQDEQVKDVLQQYLSHTTKPAEIGVRENSPGSSS